MAIIANELKESAAALTRGELAALLLVAGLYVALRLWNLPANDFWLDEVFSINAVRQNWGEMFLTLAADRVHPPLFYVLLKIWLSVNQSETWLRLFPVLFSIVTIYPFYLLCRRSKLTLAQTNFALVLVAVNDYLIHYAHELRMYSLLLFFAVGSLALFARLNSRSVINKRLLIWLFSVNLLLVYTHYFGWLIVGFEGLYLLIFKRKLFLPFAAIALFVVVCFAPWAFAVAQVAAQKRGVENLSWLTPPSVADLTGFYATLHGTFNFARVSLLHLALFGTLIALLAWRSFRYKQSSETVGFLMFYSFLPVLLVFAVSLAVPVWDYRYLIIAAAPYIVLIVASAFQFESRTIRNAAVGLVLVWAIFAGLYNFGKPNKRIACRELIERVRREKALDADAPTTVYTFKIWETAPLNFYLHDARETGFGVMQINDLNESRDKNFWLVSRDADWENKNAPQWLRRSNCRIEFEQEFREPLQKVLLVKVKNCD